MTPFLLWSYKRCLGHGPSHSYHCQQLCWILQWPDEEGEVGQEEVGLGAGHEGWGGGEVGGGGGLGRSHPEGVHQVFIESDAQYPLII